MAYSLQRNSLYSGALRPATQRTMYTDFGPNEDIRIVLVGRTGNGKSASGNTILNKKTFKSVLSPCSVTSDCEKARGVVNGCRVAVVDTPGLFDTQFKEEEVFRKLRQCISLSAPGPHVFLIVIKLDRFTAEEQETVKLLQMGFGDKAACYSMVLFTHGEMLGSTRIQDFVCQSQPLERLIRQCNGRYHVFSNTVPNYHQVTGLLEKIKRMVSENGGTFYTNNIFQEAERVIQEEARKNMMVDGQQKSKARDKAEKKNKFIKIGLALTTAKAGAVVGAVAASCAGPVCAAVGAVVGGVTGMIVGIVTPKAASALRRKCAMQ